MVKKAEEVQADVTGLIEAMNTLIDDIGPAISAAVATAVTAALGGRISDTDAILGHIDDAVMAETDKVRAAFATLTGTAPETPPSPKPDLINPEPTTDSNA